jgi:hypothetical protein
MGLTGTLCGTQGPEVLVEKWASVQVNDVGPVGIEPTTRGLKDCRSGVRARSPPYELAGQRKTSTAADRPGQSWTVCSGTQSGTTQRAPNARHTP